MTMIRLKKYTLRKQGQQQLKSGKNQRHFPSYLEFCPVVYIKTDKRRVNARVRPGTWGTAGIASGGEGDEARFRNTNVINGFRAPR